MAVTHETTYFNKINSKNKWEYTERDDYSASSDEVGPQKHDNELRVTEMESDRHTQ